ncbi:MAG: hypothetical protein GY861_13945 [bacterium]|nr:hypothetical protein [bacterium]
MVKKKEESIEPIKESVIKTDTKKDGLIAKLYGNVRGIYRLSADDIQEILGYLKSL